MTATTFQPLCSTAFFRCTIWGGKKDFFFLIKKKSDEQKRNKLAIYRPAEPFSRNIDYRNEISSIGEHCCV